MIIQQNLSELKILADYHQADDKIQFLHDNLLNFTDNNIYKLLVSLPQEEINFLCKNNETCLGIALIYIDGEDKFFQAIDSLYKEGSHVQDIKDLSYYEKMKNDQSNI